MSPGTPKFFVKTNLFGQALSCFPVNRTKDALILLHGLLPSVHFPPALLVLITLLILVHVFIDFLLLAFASLETVAQSLLLQFSLLSKQQFIPATSPHISEMLVTFFLAWQNRLTGTFTPKQTECNFILRQHQVLRRNRSLTLYSYQNMSYQFPEFPVQDLLKREPLFNSNSVWVTK